MDFWPDHMLMDMARFNYRSRLTLDTNVPYYIGRLHIAVVWRHLDDFYIEKYVQVRKSQKPGKRSVAF